MLYYDPAYYRISLKQNQPVGILVVAYNRPNYFQKVIESIESNSESRSLPFYFFLDGGVDSKQEENQTIINNSSIINKEIIMRERNYGCAKNLIDARRFMFDWCMYEKVIVIEDDIIFTPQYIRTLLALHQWAKNNYSNVGVVQCWSYCFLTKKEKKEKLHLVQNNENFWWSFVTYCLDKEAWNGMSPFLYEYEKLFVDRIPQTEDSFIERSKPSLSHLGSEIRLWVKNQIKTHNPKPAGEGPYFESNFDLGSVFSTLNKNVIANQDFMTGCSLWKAGYVKIETVVNRARHIGEHGITNNEKLFKECEFDKITLNNFDEDNTISYFEKI